MSLFLSYFTKASRDAECGICLTDFSLLNPPFSHNGDGFKHPFHYDCIRQWLTQSNRCPACKSFIDPNSCIGLKERITFIKDHLCLLTKSTMKIAFLATSLQTGSALLIDKLYKIHPDSFLTATFQNTFHFTTPIHFFNLLQSQKIILKNIRIAKAMKKKEELIAPLIQGFGNSFSICASVFFSYIYANYKKSPRALFMPLCDSLLLSTNLAFINTTFMNTQPYGLGYPIYILGCIGGIELCSFLNSPFRIDFVIEESDINYTDINTYFKIAMISGCILSITYKSITWITHQMEELIPSSNDILYSIL